MRRLGLLALVLALAGCGGSGAGGGTAQLWVTRDRGETVVLTATVPAGQTLLQALRSQAKVETRYGGRFVQSIGGVEGSVARQRDWFWFLNGLEGDRSAAEVRLHAGDVEWWDYRSWAGGNMSVPVVVGAFPQPFLASDRPAVVVGGGLAAARLAKLVGGTTAASAPADANVLRIVPGRGFTARRDGGRVVFTVGAEDAGRLARDPSLARHRYEGLP